MSEIDTRLRIINTLLTTPHKRMEEIHQVHQQMINQDPLFYQSLGTWYCNTGAIRDHKEAFVINLCLSQFEGHRDIGLALLRDLPPFQVTNVIDFIHGKTIKRKTTSIVAGKKITTSVPEKVGLNKNIPRSMVTEITNYLRQRESDEDFFQSTALVARKSLKRLYALLHIKPSELAQQILFDDKPPEGSRLDALKKLAGMKTPAEQAKVIMENKIPYRIACTVVQQMTPTVMYALLEVMSPQELINSIGMLKKRGVFDSPELSKLVTEKLEKAKTSKKDIAALKAMEAIKATGIDGEVAKKLAEVADVKVKARGRITVPTLMIVDRSGSMSIGIDVGRAIAGTIAPVCSSEFYVYAVDTMPQEITAKEHTVEGWNRAFAPIRAGGGTNLSVAFQALDRQKRVVEQIIVVSDQGDNDPRSFPMAYTNYCRKYNVTPKVVFVRCGHSSDMMEKALISTGADISSLTANSSDYYSLPGLVDLLSKGSRLDLLMEIMAVELPQRKKAVQQEAVGV